jgi:protein-disulfide isomerase
VVGALLWQHADIPADRLHAQLLARPEFLADHPDLLGGAQAVLQSRRLAAQRGERIALMRGKWQYIMHAAFTPTVGPADAPLTLLEFTDYTCEPCRLSAPAMREVLRANSDVRVAVLLMPTGGALSEYAARIALAAYRQDPTRFATLHDRLMEPEAPLTQQGILAVVSTLHYDVDQITREASSSETRRYFSEVRMFAEEMNIPAVPAFVMSDQLVLGRVQSAQLGALIKLGRSAPVPDTHAS